MKLVKFRVIQPDPQGPTYGQVPKASDLMKSQIFANDRINAVIRDWIVGACAQSIIAGFTVTRLGGMALRVSAPGHVIGADGQSYEMIDTEYVDLTVPAADPDLHRVDLLIVTLESEVDAANEQRPFIRLRTQAELESGVAPFSPQQFNEPTEEHTRGVVSIKSGVAAETPAEPELASNERAIKRITVRPAATQIEDEDLADVAHRVSSLCVLEDRLNDLIDEFNKRKPLDHEHYAREIIIGPSSKKWANKRVQEFIDFWEGYSDDDGTDPLTMPETLTATGKLGGDPDLDGQVPVIDIPYPKDGIQVAFSDRIVTIDSDPARWPAEAMPQLVNKSEDSETEYLKHATQLSMAVVDSIRTDGGGEWQKETATFPAALGSVNGRLSAARDSRFVEFFGAGNGPSWQTYDTVEETLISRNFSGQIPTRQVMFVAPCGNGDILFATKGVASPSLQWFRVEAESGITIAVPQAPGQPDDPTTTAGGLVMGDLIQTDVLLIAVFNDATQVWRYFAYHVDSNSFELLVITGQGPEPGSSPAGANYDMCLYQPGEAVIVSGDAIRRPISTTVLNYATRTFSRLYIPQPGAGRSRGSFTNYRIANVNGRPHLVGGLTRWDGTGIPNTETAGAYVWELTPGSKPEWREVATSLPARTFPTIASLLTGGLARGNGYFAGGWTSFGNTKRNDLWEFVAGGVVETIFEGQVGLTLGVGALQATFRVLNVPVLTWQVAKALVEARGFIPPGTVRVKLSVDGGQTFKEMPLKKIVDGLTSSNPAQRALEITMIRSGVTAPILTDLLELFERPEGPGLETVLVLRIKVPAGTKALRLSREGLLTFVAAIEPTVPDSAILWKTTHNGNGVEAALKEYENRRLIHRKFTGAKAGGVDPTFQYDFARAPKYKDARAVTGGATGALYKIADPAIAFDSQVTVAGVTSNGDNYIVECEA